MFKFGIPVKCPLRKIRVRLTKDWLTVVQITRLLFIHPLEVGLQYMTYVTYFCVCPSLFFVLKTVSLCSPYCPTALCRPDCFCVSSAGIKGKCHCACFNFHYFTVYSQFMTIIGDSVFWADCDRQQMVTWISAVAMMFTLNKSFPNNTIQLSTSKL